MIDWRNRGLKPFPGYFDPALAPPEWDWFWRELQVAYIGGEPVNPVTGKFGAPEGQYATGVTEYGSALNARSTTASDSQGVDFTDWPRVGRDAFTDGVSLFALVKPENDLPNATRRIVCVVPGGPSVGDPALSLEYDQTNGQWRSTSWVSRTFGTASPGVWASVGATVDADGFRGYQNGAEALTSGPPTHWNTRTGDTFRVAPCSGLTDHLKFRGSVAVAYYWARRLTADEHRQISADPFGPFRQITYRPVLGAGGGGLTLSVQAAGIGHQVDAVSLTQASTLTAQGLEHGFAADALNLVQAYTLTVQEAGHAVGVDSPSLTQAHLLALEDALHAHQVDALTLTQAGELTVQAASLAHSVDGLSLEAGNTLTIASLLHAHAVDALTLTQAHLLSVADALLAHGVDSPEVSIAVLLALEDALHAHAVDALTLTQAHLLAPDSPLLGTTTEGLSLTQAHLLELASVLHSMAADNVDFNPPLAPGSITVTLAAALGLAAALTATLGLDTELN